MEADNPQIHMTPEDLDTFVREAVMRMCAEAGHTLVPRLTAMFEAENHKMESFITSEFMPSDIDPAEMAPFTDREGLIISAAVTFTLAMILDMPTWVASMEDQGFTVNLDVDNPVDKSPGSNGHGSDLPGAGGPYTPHP